jgi:hypothetical protein
MLRDWRPTGLGRTTRSPLQRPAPQDAGDSIDLIVADRLTLSW